MQDGDEELSDDDADTDDDTDDDNGPNDKDMEGGFDGKDQNRMAASSGQPNPNGQGIGGNSNGYSHATGGNTLNAQDQRVLNEGEHAMKIALGRPALT